MRRLKLALHVLRGRPIVYRTKFHGPIRIVDTNHLRITECTFLDGGIALDGDDL